MDDRFAAMEERMAVLEEMLLEEAAYAPQYVEPQPRYERRLQPVGNGDKAGICISVKPENYK
jgi:hypothetical protein